MIRRYAFGMLAVAGMLVVAAPAQAGGGVKSTTIKASNSSGVTVVALSVDPNKIPTPPTTVAEAKKIGGVVIPNGGTKNVKVLSGNGMYFGAIAVADGGLLDLGVQGYTPYSLKKNASTTALISGVDGPPPTGLTVTVPKP